MSTVNDASCENQLLDDKTKNVIDDKVFGKSFQLHNTDSEEVVILLKRNYFIHSVSMSLLLMIQHSQWLN